MIQPLPTPDDLLLAKVADIVFPIVPGARCSVEADARTISCETAGGGHVTLPMDPEPTIHDIERAAFELRSLRRSSSSG